MANFHAKLLFLSENMAFYWQIVEKKQKKHNFFNKKVCLLKLKV